MNNKKNAPLRMCVICKIRLAQKILLRFTIDNQKLQIHTGVGRSIYICDTCFDINNIKMVKILNGKYNINQDELQQFFKINFKIK